MSISREDSSRTSPALSFRARLTLLLTLTVFSVALLALFFTQRTEQTALERTVQDEFHGRLGFLLGTQETREAEVAERCRSLAQSVRIQAALEEQDIEDLYAVARIELRDVLADRSDAPADNSNLSFHATFYRFVTSDGRLLLPSDAKTTPVAWDDQLAAVHLGATSQQTGYLAVEKPDGKNEVIEVVATPILGEDGEPLATLVLGFPVPGFVANPSSDLKTGLLLSGQLYFAGLPPEETKALVEPVSSTIKSSAGDDSNFKVQVGTESYLLFYKLLNPASPFPKAYEISLYSMADFLAHQQRLRWEILGLAALILVAGLGLSHFFSIHLSRPVEQLARVSEQNLAGRRQAEAERQVTEQKYRSIFENAVEGIFLLAPDGSCSSANPAMARIFGYDSAAHLISDWAKDPGGFYLRPADQASFLQRVTKESAVSGCEFEARRKDGTTIWISQSARAVRDASGAVLHFEGTMEDITDRKAAADRLKSLNSELEKTLAELKATQNQIIQQERLRALGQMASGIAHDFNNALMPIMGFAELLLSQPAVLADQKKAVGYLDTIRTAAKDATSIVARLREFYRSNENNDVFNPVDLSQLARQAISLTQPKWKGQAHAGGITIEMVEELGNVPAIFGDESALREVLTNLIFNAVDAMPSGGSITLRTCSDGARVVLEVSDTGSGMSEEVRARCLEPFFTTKGDRGTGLGLAMVFGIVQRHEGTIDLRSTLGQGTTFILSFPRASGSASAAVKTAALPSMRKLHILLVDDEPQVREVLAAFLEIDGHSVTCAGDGLEGLKQFRSEKFDLVITDKAIPGMSGDQMALEIKKISPKVPVVLLSGFNSTGTEEKIPGVDVIASKPITMPMLRKVIRKAMETA